MRTYKNVVDISDIRQYAIENFDHFTLDRYPKDVENVDYDECAEYAVDEIIEYIFSGEFLNIYPMELKYVDMKEVEFEINSIYYNIDECGDRNYRNFYLILQSFMSDNYVKYLYITYEHNSKEELNGDIYPRDPREFNYYFKIGDIVMVDPDRWSFEYKPGEHLATHLGPYIGMVGEVIKCESDVHSFAQGSTYWCAVKFGDEIVEQMCSEFIKIVETEG